MIHIECFQQFVSLANYFTFFFRLKLLRVLLVDFIKVFGQFLIVEDIKIFELGWLDEETNDQREYNEIIDDLESRYFEGGLVVEQPERVLEYFGSGDTGESEERQRECLGDGTSY